MDQTAEPATPTPPSPPPPPPAGPPGPGAATRVVRPPGPRLSPIWWGAGPLLVACVAVITVLASVRLPYYAIAPGSARPVEPRITITKASAQKPGEDILFVTVSGADRPSGLETVIGWLQRDVDVYPEELITGGQSEQQNDRFNLQLMTSSKDVATKVALEKLGYPVVTKETGAVIEDLSPTYPVAKVVHPGDTVVEADGRPIRNRAGLVAAIQAHRPGDTMRLTVEAFPDNARRTVRTTVAANPDDPTKPQLGVTIQTRPRFTFPVDVSIDTQRIGGPSAGLAFTLALLDRLTPGSLTGGKKVAVSGTIELDGSVGPVGGIKQKTVAAIRAGATTFIVPPDEYRDAKAAARGRLRVEKAGSLDAALRILGRLGGNAERLGTPGRSGR